MSNSSYLKVIFAIGLGLFVGIAVTYGWMMKALNSERAYSATLLKKINTSQMAK
jgi:hypothetical protein